MKRCNMPKFPQLRKGKATLGSPNRAPCIPRRMLPPACTEKVVCKWTAWLCQVVMWWLSSKTDAFGNQGGHFPRTWPFQSVANFKYWLHFVSCHCPATGASFSACLSLERRKRKKHELWGHRTLPKWEDRWLTFSESVWSSLRWVINQGNIGWAWCL